MKREADRLPKWRKDRLRIVLCCQSLPSFIKMATEEKTAMLGFLKWELSIKSNKQLFDFIMRLRKGIGIVD